MEGQRPCAFPLLVRGDWGPAEPPPALRKKLLCYFQSQKRSGGGECELRTGTGTGTGHIIVCFARPEVRERVLHQPVHELVWGSGERLSLRVTALPAAGDPAQEAGAAAGTQAPVNKSQVSLPICQNKETPVCAQQEKTESCEKLEAEKATSRNSAVVVTTAFGEEIEDEILEMYFENKRRSGGGDIESYVKKDEQVIITFQDEQDAQEVLQRKHHLKNIDLVVRPWQVQTSQELCQVENTEGSLLPTAVVLENVKETIKDGMLILLVENVSGLSEDDGDFSVEMIPELCAAVVTFTGNTDAKEFAKKLNQNPRARKQNITARCLEQTKSVRVENIPPNTPSHYITVYFENEKYGGAQTVDVQLLPDEDAALITFGNPKDVTNILAKKHSLNKTPIFVYPYYTSLETALYGKEGPQIKKPDPITLPLDPYIWNYLQGNSSLVEAIGHEMAKCNCVPTWPDPLCADPKVTLHPSAIFSQRKRSVSQLAKTWKEKVSAAFSHSISKYEAIQCQVSTEVWEAIGNSFPHDKVLMIPRISEDLHVLVGEKEVVKKVEQELKLLIQKATREIEREKQRTELKVEMVNPGEYVILQIIGLEEKFHAEFPDLQITYDYMQKCIKLSGVSEEVYKVKGEILEHVHKMAKKTINVHPYILQFLEHIDNETLSQSLFVSKQISAFYELGAGEVILKASDPEDLLKAEKEMKKELAHKSIALDDESVLQKEEWQMLAKTTCSNGAVAVTQAETQIVIAGLSEAVAKAFEELSNFIDENTQVQRVIEGKPMALIKFFKKEKVNAWAPLQEKGVKVDFGTQKICDVISLSGPKTKVLEGVILVEQILSGLHFKRVVIDLPGAKAYIKEQAHFLDSHIKQVFKCLVLLEEEPEKQLEEQKVHGNRGKICMQVTVGKTVVALYEADLCTHPVDVVVNASNEDLRHIGGLADALSGAAGPALQQECDELVRKHGNLQPGCAVITGAGNLPCKNVIHAVGPRWNEKESQTCTWLLKQTVRKCLQLADIYNHCSIALPAISGGIFGFPPQMCADSIVTSIKETLEEFMEGSSLKEVHLVSNSEEIVQVLSETVKKVFSAKSSSARWLMAKKSQKEKSKGDLKMVTTKEGLCIRVEKKNVQEAVTDVVVNSVGTDLKFGVGPLCNALLGRAGQGLQDEFDTAVKSQVAGPGTVLCTSACAMACKFMFHAILPVWDGGQTEKVLEDIINLCLKKTEELGLKSITFPAIGTGGFGFPKTIVSKLMFDVAFRFSSSQAWKNLQEVHFLLSPKDIDSIQAFTTELKLRADESCNAAAAQPGFIRPVSSELLGVHEMKIGSITLQVISGDITKQDTEVIVNISNQTFDAKTGVFKAIMDAAGSQVADECAQHAGQNQSGFVTTQGGNLLCSKIIHLISDNQVKSQVSKVLHECERRMYKSVAFPAIGTGQAGLSSAKVADEMLDAIVEFARQKSVQHLQTIKIVIFQTNMLRDFYESMKKREDSDSSTTESWFSMLKSFFWGRKQSSEKKKVLNLEKKVNLVTFQICGESQKKVDETESWIKDLILKEQFENTISHEVIESFDETQIAILEDLQRRMQVTVQFKNNLSPPQIKISGISRDVCSVSQKVQEMIQQIKSCEEEQSKAELLFNLVEWRYPGSNDSFVSFDKLTNMQLEHAKISKKLHLNVKIENKNYRVDLNTLKATDDQGNTINLQRVRKDEDMQSIELPKEWTDMQNEQVKVVELKPSHPEYKRVEKMFKTTCANFTIEKIERIQSRILWQTYQLKKKSICEKNKNQNNEKLLFHGTAASSLRLINSYGFNRGFAGKNAAAIGNGTYFAVEARYSARDTYSVPDVNGKKHMYLAQVLTGKYCAGRRGINAPPPRSQADPTDLYDSVVDNESNPTMFVIFNDIQAYPQYLITFK